jgi:type IV pilus assembly protein PilN
MIRINLLKPETKEIKEVPVEGAPDFKAKKRPGVGNLIFLLLLIALGGYYFYQKKAIDRENELLAQARDEKNKYQYVIAKLDELQSQKASLERKIGLINLLKSQQDLAVRVMDELSRGLPEWVWLNEVSTDSKSIQIRGNALSNNLVADFIANLENSAYFEGVNLISSTQRTAQNDQFLEFSLTAGVINPKQPVQVSAAAPPPAADPNKRRLP